MSAALSCLYLWFIIVYGADITQHGWEELSIPGECRPLLVVLVVCLELLMVLI